MPGPDQAAGAYKHGLSTSWMIGDCGTGLFWPENHLGSRRKEQNIFQDPGICSLSLMDKPEVPVRRGYAFYTVDFTTLVAGPAFD